MAPRGFFVLTACGSLVWLLPVVYLLITPLPYTFYGCFIQKLFGIMNVYTSTEILRVIEKNLDFFFESGVYGVAVDTVVRDSESGNVESIGFYFNLRVGSIIDIPNLLASFKLSFKDDSGKFFILDNVDVSFADGNMEFLRWHMCVVLK